MSLVIGNRGNDMSSAEISSVCILGGGTAGWMTAAGIANKFNGLGVSITLAESERIGTVGVGEATLPHIRFFNQTLGIDEREFMRATNATFKLGIEFRDWGALGEAYVHPFGDYGAALRGVDFHQLWLRMRQAGAAGRLDDYSFPVRAAEEDRFQHPGGDVAKIGSNFGYAYQMDSGAYAALLRRYAEARGVARVEGEVAGHALDPETGHVESLALRDGRRIAADLFIDCSGFRGLLIEEALGTGYDDWRDWLPCDRAFAVQCEGAGHAEPYTRATARAAGWQWRIPLQHRIGNGHVYSSAFTDDEPALEQLTSTLEGPAITEPRQLFFTTGKRRKLWHRNVVAIGLSGGFLEPLESTSIHLIQEGLTHLIELFPDASFDQADIDEYNARMDLNFERIRDFLLLHYVATRRDDTEMWRHFRALTLPDSLRAKIDAWMTRGYLTHYEYGTFLPPSWVAVMMGQGLVPRAHDPAAGAVAPDEAARHAEAIRRLTSEAVARTAPHAAYLDRFVAA